MTIVIIVGTKGTEKLSAAKHQQTKNLSTYQKNAVKSHPKHWPLQGRVLRRFVWEGAVFTELAQADTAARK